METIVKMILSTLQLMNRNLCHLAAGESLESLENPPAGAPSPAQRVHEGTTDTHRIGTLERLISGQGDDITRLRARLDQLSASANTTPRRWTDDAIDLIVHEGQQAIAALQDAHP